MGAAGRVRNDYRTWLLLVLALVPVWSVLGGAGWLWVDRGREIETFEASIVPVETTFQIYLLNTAVVQASVSMAAASLPGATDATRALAERDKAAALQKLEESGAILEPLIAQLGEQRKPQDQRAVDALLVDALANAGMMLQSQAVGEPLNAQMSAVISVARENTAGLVLPFVGTQDREATYLYDALASTVLYHDIFDRDRANLLEAFAKERSTLSDPTQRQSQWKDLIDARTVVSQVRDVDWSIESGDVTTLALTERVDPLNTVLGEATSDLAQVTVAQRDTLLLTLHQIGEDLVADARLTMFEFDREMTSHIASLHRDRTTLLAVSGVVAVLGLALALLTMAEVRNRRKVERAHGRAVDQLSVQANLDPTTQTWNRRYLESRLGPLITAANQNGQIVVLAYIDLDHFKTINDVWGHNTGDAVLRTTAERLKHLTRPDADFEVVRFGGDEFVLYASVTPKPLRWLESLGATIIDTIDGEISIKGRGHSIGASVGIATSNAESTADSLLLEADSSLILAKANHRGTSVVYDRNSSRTGELVTALPDALANGEICANFQPIVDIATHEIIHVEALARWTRPNGEVVSPSVFIPLVESYGMTEELTATIVRCVRSFLEHEATPDSAEVWINISPQELDVANVAERLLTMLQFNRLPPNRIGIEITETAVVRDVASLASELRQLKQAGVRVAIDDFGSGYSPLGHLRDLPLDAVKLDRSLITHIDTDTASQHIVLGVLGLIDELGHNIIAEGVERSEEEAWLQHHGVTRTQGFLRGRPEPPTGFGWHQRHPSG